MEVQKKKDTDTKMIFKSSIWYIISNFLTRALSFITIPIFSRILTTEEFGKFHVYANWQNTLMIIAGLEIYATINRARFDYDSKESLNSYISTCLVVSTIITAVLFITYLIFNDTINKLFLMDKKYIMIMFAYLLTRPAFETFQIEQRVHYRYRLSAGISFIMVTFTTLFALILALLMSHDHLFGRIAGQYIPYVILGVIFYTFYMLRNHYISWEKAKYAVKLAVPLVFSYLGGQILLSSDKIIVQHLSSVEAVAYLSIATSCAHIMLLFVQSLNNAWSPWFYDKLAVGENMVIRKTFRIYLWLVIIGTFGSLLIGPELVLILGGAHYKSSVILLPANMTAGAFTLIVSQLGAFETYHKKAHYAAVVTSITASINVFLDIIGVKIFGYAAVCYVTVICYILLIDFHLIVSRKLGIFEVFSLREIMVEIVAILALIPISLLLYQRLVLRYATLTIFIFLIVTGVMVSRKKIIGFCKENK